MSTIRYECTRCQTSGACRILSNGTFEFAPCGWQVSRTGTGVYKLTVPFASFALILSPLDADMFTATVTPYTAQVWMMLSTGDMLDATFDVLVYMPDLGVAAPSLTGDEIAALADSARERMEQTLKERRA